MESHSGRSRRGIMTGVAVLVSGVYPGIADWIGMPLDHPWELLLFSALSITAVAVVALSSSCCRSPAPGDDTAGSHAPFVRFLSHLGLVPTTSRG
ncbi:hypothetical protein F3K43_31230 [Streptomyces sp. LBUM 1476]|nr:hypothetical protein [Streptomyces acidiscabies]MBP5939948.1 hypothetical protein [Streptomyces sp. LBUM 1476]